MLKKSLLFAIGGSCYVGLELLWRGWSHGSMFLAGGTACLLLGKLRRSSPRLSPAVRGLAGAGIITAVELAAGLAANREYTVWDYRDMPINFRGQICLPFSLLWIPVSLGAMAMYSFLEKRLEKR